eukprot:UN11726
MLTLSSSLLYISLFLHSSRQDFCYRFYDINRFSIRFRC